MSFLRRRTTSTSSRAEPKAAGQALAAPLLVAREEEEEGGASANDDADGALIASTSSSSPPSFAAQLWRTLVASPVSTALSLLAPLLPASWRPFHMPVAAQRALDALREDAATPFDPLSPDHEADLRELWAASFEPSSSSPRPPYPPGGKSPLWKEAGWQGEDPRTDLRGGGRGALTAALHMRRERPLLWARLRDKRREVDGGGNNSWVAPEGLEYPFGAAGVNVAFMVSQVAGLHSHDAESGAAAAAAAASSSSALASAAPVAGSVSAGGKGRGPAPSRGPPRTAAAKGFAALLLAEGEGERGGGENRSGEGEEEEKEDDAHSVALRLHAWSVFGDVYCAAFEALDDEWCSRKASYLDFPAVMSATRSRLERALASRRAGDAREGLRRELQRHR